MLGIHLHVWQNECLLCPKLQNTHALHMHVVYPMSGVLHGLSDGVSTTTTISIRGCAESMAVSLAKSSQDSLICTDTEQPVNAGGLQTDDIVFQMI